MACARLYEFGEFRLDADGRLLFRNGEVVPLTPKAVETLLLLVENKGNVVEKDELMQRIWPRTFVEESSLTRNISVLRKALGNGADGQEFIATVPKRGYRFIAPVEEIEEPSRPSSAIQETRRTKAARRVWHRPAVWLAALTLAGVLAVTAYLGRRHSWFRITSPSGRIMLAVLPVQNLSGDAEREYVSDGLTDEVIAQLARLNPQQLGVIARTSAMTYKKAPKTVEQVGRELGVDYVVEGSVRWTGDHLRVTAQLIRVRDQTHVWAQTYDRSITDIVALEAEVARAVAQEIQIRLATQANAHLAPIRPIVPEAHLSLLEGRYYWNKRSRAALERSIVHLQQAIQIDPGYAQAHAGLADAYASLALIGDVSSTEMFQKAEAAALAALKLDDSLAEAHTALAYVKFYYDWDWPGAELEFKRAIDLNPAYATAHQWHAEYLRLMGRQQEAIVEGKKALELDPLSLIINMELGLPYYYLGQYDEAIRHFRKVLELDPTFALAYCDLGWAYEEKGEYQKALEALETAKRLDDTAAILASLGHTYAMLGKKREAEQVLRQLAERSKQTYVSPYFPALIHVALGEDERALDGFEKAYSEHFWGMVWLSVGRKTARLRSNPRFAELIRRMAFPPHPAAVATAQ